jgi:hypothetical protein
MRPLYSNLLIASNLYRASALITVVAYFLSDKAQATFPELLTVALTLIAAYLIRLGLKWLKWLLLLWELVYLPGFIMGLLQPWAGNEGVNILSIIVELLQIAALVFLFLPRDENNWVEDDEDDEVPQTANE